jgi:hypothetical protein
MFGRMAAFLLAFHALQHSVDARERAAHTSKQAAAEGKGRAGNSVGNGVGTREMELRLHITRAAGCPQLS